MEAETILITMATAAGLGWAGWVSVMVIKANERANKSLIQDEVAKNEINAIVDSMDKMASDLKQSFRDLSTEVKNEMKSTNLRLDLFVKEEIDVLKKLADK